MNSLDFLNIGENFSAEEKLIQQTARDFVQSEIMPVIADHFEKGTFPKNLVRTMGELGFLGCTIQGYECAGVSETAYGLIMQELERGDSGIRSFASVQGALCMYPISAYATEDIKKKYLPKMAKGEMIGCFGLTEADFGSNPGGMQTRARKDGNEYVLNGSKMWITNGGIADLAIVWAKGDDDKICGFIVDKGLKGFKTRDIGKKFSLRASVTSELIFEDVRVPATHKLNVSGLKGPFSCLNNARFGIVWGVLGAAQACLTEAVTYSKSRVQFTKPLAGYQLVQSKLVWMWNEITKGQLLAVRLAELKQKGVITPQQISMGKMNNVSMALQCARLTRDILGASGITY